MHTGSSVALITTENFTFTIHTIRFPNFNRIRIILGFGKSCKYEYEYIQFWKYLTNTIWIPLFGLKYSNIIQIPNYSDLTQNLSSQCIDVYHMTMARIDFQFQQQKFTNFLFRSLPAYQKVPHTKQQQGICLWPQNTRDPGPWFRVSYISYTRAYVVFGCWTLVHVGPK